MLSQALLPKKPEGLVAAYEMMVVTPAIRNLIRENKTYRIDSSIQTGRKHGMFLLDESLFRLWKEDLCEKEEVLAEIESAHGTRRENRPGRTRLTTKTKRKTRMRRTRRMRTMKKKR